MTVLIGYCAASFTLTAVGLVVYAIRLIGRSE